MEEVHSQRAFAGTQQKETKAAVQPSFPLSPEGRDTLLLWHIAG